MRRLFTARIGVLGLVVGWGVWAGEAVGQTPAGTAFTFQGRLTNAGSPATGLYDAQFRLFNAATLGSPVGSIVCLDGISPNPDGTFTTVLDFGAVATGPSLWIEVSVRADATPGNCGNGTYTLLTPRQRLTPTPYAMGVSLPLSESQAVDVFTGAAFTITNTSTLNATYGIKGVSNSNNADSAGVVGISMGTTGVVAGVSGQTASTQGFGVTGLASNSAAGAGGIGVFGLSNGPQGGAGVFAHATSTFGVTYGVLSWDDSNSGTGVVGAALSTTGTTYGVLGQSNSTAGTGVKGVAGAATGNTIGVYAESASSNGAGLYSHNTALTGTPLAIRATTSAPNSITVLADCDAFSGSSVAVLGSVNSPDGVAVQGDKFASTGSLPAIRGSTQSASANATAILGTVFPTNPGSFSAGVSGVNNGTGGLGIGVSGTQNGSGYGVYGTTPAGSGVRGEATDVVSINFGVYGSTSSPNGYGVYGTNGGANGYAGYFAQKVYVGGDLMHKFTAAGTDQRMTPIAYGDVAASGALNSGTSNVTSSLSGTTYLVTIAGETYQFQTYTAIITPATGTTPVIATTSSGGGQLQVRLFTLAGALTNGDFHFIVYKR